MSALSHELIHSYNDFNDRAFMTRIADNSMDTGSPYSFPNAEEKYTVGLQNQVNGKLGESIRASYAIYDYPTVSATSTKFQANPVPAKPTKIKKQ